MNEEYIKGFRKSPDSRLAERIYARLAKKERVERIKRYSFLSTLALMFVFGMLMTFSSRVRADVISYFMRIGGVPYTITAGPLGNPYIPTVEIEPEFLSWEEARTRFSSPLQLPTYVPRGYEREAEVRFSVWGLNEPALQVIWRNEEQSWIQLFIDQCSEDMLGCGMAAGEGALKEITLNGQPAALIRGGWDEAKQQYDLSGSIHVVWRYDENTVYVIWSSNVSLVEELIRMAESVP